MPFHTKLLRKAFVAKWTDQSQSFLDMNSSSEAVKNRSRRAVSVCNLRSDGHGRAIFHYRSRRGCPPSKTRSYSVHQKMAKQLLCSFISRELPLSGGKILWSDVILWQSKFDGIALKIATQNASPRSLQGIRNMKFTVHQESFWKWFKTVNSEFSQFFLWFSSRKPKVRSTRCRHEFIFWPERSKHFNQLRPVT